VILEAQDGLPALKQYGKVENNELLAILQQEARQGDTFCIEKILSYGGKIGRSTLDTCEWSGRFIQVAFQQHMEVVPLGRKTVVASLTGNATHGDSHVRAALVALLGEEYVAKNLSNTDKRSAYAVGLCYLGIGNRGKIVQHTNRRGRNRNRPQ
jgi:Holliday junction resolvasome RuvABC endonuclease subunit